MSPRVAMLEPAGAGDAATAGAATAGAHVAAAAGDATAGAHVAATAGVATAGTHVAAAAGDAAAARRVAVIACGALALDVRMIARRRGWEVDLYPVPAPLHNRPEQIPAAVDAEIARLDGNYERVAIAYGDCGTYGALDALLTEHGIERLQADSCYDMFAREEVRAALDQQPGTYLLTDFLARTFEHTVIRELGLDRHPELLGDYFGNYTRVLWLAQRRTPENEAAAERAAARIGLPLEVLAVGNTGLERALERLVEPAASVLAAPAQPTCSK